MTTRELRRQCERFTARMLADGANANELIGLLLGAMMRVLRDQGVSRDLYMRASALLWDDNNPSDTPVED